ncbi:probable peroxidase 26 [Typha latifolia]|uniref:probable peroxidase 26 n=1 Tax=Typha latifolia TaxID=4733 RepID=UPI003C2C8179
MMSMRCKGVDYWLVLFVVLQQILNGAQVHAQGNPRLPLNGLVMHYYKVTNTCTYAEEFVKHQVKLAWEKDHSVAAALLRLLYSDCFVTGCDASVLLDGEESEKAAPQNSGLRGFDVVDRIKKVLEIRCPGAVSCADILHLATRDAVALAGAPKYPVFTGRRDGMSSSARLVDLPPPSVTWNQALSYFQAHGLDELDLGALLGAHTMGVTHCRYIYDRLYDFNNTGKPDKTMANSIIRELRKKCRSSAGSTDPTVFLNPSSGSNYSFESSYYYRTMQNLAVLGIDQQFTATSNGKRIAAQFRDGFEDFRRYFALSISRMGSLGVLTKDQGEIRSNCHYTNANNPGLK